MAHERHVDLLDEFDALLRQTMSVEPSAEFLPRARERVGREPVTPQWGRWQVLALAASLSVIVMIAVRMPGGTPQVQAPPHPPVLTNMQSSNHRGTEDTKASSLQRKNSVPSVLPWLKDVPAAGLLPPVRPIPASRMSPARATSFEIVPAVVVIDKRQRAAVAMVMRLVGEGKLTDEAFAQTTPQSMGAIREQVLPVDVAPLEVSPIAVGGVLQKEE
jgi:hypothetical protein